LSVLGVVIVVLNLVGCEGRGKGRKLSDVEMGVLPDKQKFDDVQVGELSTYESLRMGRNNLKTDFAPEHRAFDRWMMVLKDWEIQILYDYEPADIERRLRYSGLDPGLAPLPIREYLGYGGEWDESLDPTAPKSGTVIPGLAPLLIREYLGYVGRRDESHGPTTVESAPAIPEPKSLSQSRSKIQKMVEKTGTVMSHSVHAPKIGDSSLIDRSAEKQRRRDKKKRRISKLAHLKPRLQNARQKANRQISRAANLVQRTHHFSDLEEDRLNKAKEKPSRLSGEDGANGKEKGFTVTRNPSPALKQLPSSAKKRAPASPKTWSPIWKNGSPKLKDGCVDGSKAVARARSRDFVDGRVEFEWIRGEGLEIVFPSRGGGG
jgi:hypothetical protein